MKDNKKTVRKRNILYLIENFLAENGYKETAQFLRNEAKLNKDYCVCDNINIETIVIEYETFYHHRFQTYPQLCKRTTFPETSPKRCFKTLFKEHWSSKNVSDSCIETEPDLAICTTSLTNAFSEEKCSKEKEFKNIIQDTCVKTLKTNWDDVKGLEHVKEILKEAIVYPIKYPYLFNGVIEPWKGILLYGPPGTGKTSLAKAVANESTAKFFNVSASLLVNKWRGESEKLIKELFEMAHDCAPSIIFIDEIDAITLKRNACEHEASRRMKSEIFARMDNLAESKENVFFLGTTNTPWDLDEAMLRRFEKHILVSSPDKETRKLLFKHFLPRMINADPLIESSLDYENAADVTENFSGCDIKHICKELIMNSMRQIFANLESRSISVNHKMWHNYHCFVFLEISANKLSRKTITNQDFETIFESFRPTVHHLWDRYLKWESERKKN